LGEWCYAWTGVEGCVVWWGGAGAVGEGCVGEG
jgi:hypothetical protein